MERQIIRVLLIEDDPEYAMMMSVYINKACGQSVLYALESAARLKTGLDLLARKEFDILLLDLNLPDSRGLDTLIQIREKAPGLPAVVLTNLEQDNIGLEAIAHGAQDFLIKAKIDGARLQHSIGFALARNRVFRQMETLVDTSPDGIVIVDRDRMVRYANPAALALFGWTREQMIGRAFEHEITPDRPEELALNPAPGREISAEMRVAEIEWKGAPAWLASIRDVSELKKLEQARAEIREHERTDQLKDRLLGAVSHELRTPLSVVDAIVGAFRDELTGPLTQEQAGLIASADRNIARLKKLLSNFLDLSRLESRRARVSRCAIDPLALVREVTAGVRMANRERAIAVDCDLPEALPKVHADADMIAQVLGNLLDNALRFARGRVVVRAAPAPEAVEVSVVDDGPGIPAEKFSDLFNKFVQLDRPRGGAGYKGTGLGLAISREIMSLNDGKIWAEKAAGGGACFRFTLPLAAAAEAREESHAGANA